MDYGDRIFQLRKSHGLTRKQLAVSTGMSEESVKCYERRSSKPAYDGLMSLADFFNVSIDYLVGRSNNPARLP